MLPSLKLCSPCECELQNNPKHPKTPTLLRARDDLAVRKHADVLLDDFLRAPELYEPEPLPLEHQVGLVRNKASRRGL